MVAESYLRRLPVEKHLTKFQHSRFHGEQGLAVRASVGGAMNAVANFCIGQLQDLQSAAMYIGSSEQEVSIPERLMMFNAMEKTQAAQLAMVERGVARMFTVDPSHPTYQASMYWTSIGLEVGAVAYTGYRAVQGVMAVNRLAKMPAALANESLVARHILTRTKIRNYLAEVKSVSKQQFISDLESIGLKFKGKSPDGRFLEFQDAFSNTRVKIHPPDKMTRYDHLHLYDKRGNSLNQHLKIVNSRSVEAHIPFGDKQ